MAEWLRRQIRNLLDFIRVGSSPASVVGVLLIALPGMGFYEMGFHAIGKGCSINFYNPLLTFPNMGRSKKNMKRRAASYPLSSCQESKRKRWKQRERFWIEDCPETGAAAGGRKYIIEILITRIELTDDYTQVPQDPQERQQQRATSGASDEENIEGKPKANAHGEEHEAEPLKIESCRELATKKFSVGSPTNRNGGDSDRQRGRDSEDADDLSASNIISPRGESTVRIDESIPRVESIPNSNTSLDYHHGESKVQIEKNMEQVGASGKSSSTADSLNTATLLNNSAEKDADDGSSSNANSFFDASTILVKRAQSAKRPLNKVRK